MDVPVYVHCPLITDESHHKLSKRSGHSSFEDLWSRALSLAEAVVNYVALWAGHRRTTGKSSPWRRW